MPKPAPEKSAAGFVIQGTSMDLLSRLLEADENGGGIYASADDVRQILDWLPIELVTPDLPRDDSRRFIDMPEDEDTNVT
jgi:hypothetical protein